MLMRFTIKNWMSYKNRTEVSMIATKEQQHGDRVPKFKRLQTRILPLAIFFGGNASGKTNIFKALEFAKFFVTRGNMMSPTAPIPVEPYLLDEDSRYDATEFAFTLLVGEEVYDYSFSVTRDRVVCEELKRITAPSKGFSYKRVYNGVMGVYEMEYGKSLEGERALLDLIARTTRQNQLFLLTAIMQNFEPLRPVYDWFENTLQMVSPNSSYMSSDRYVDGGISAFARMNELLSDFDTGIKHIDRRPIDIAAMPIPAQYVEELARTVREGETVRVEVHGRTLPYLLTRVSGKIVAEKLIACHPSHAKGEIREFELEHESDGTKRIIDLLPAIVDMENKGASRVYVIDEIDRCLHTRASGRLIQAFLNSCSGDSRCQMLATTHDVILMSQSLLRRDEIWLVERNRDEISELSSVSDFVEARKDSDLMHSYLVGRMGGIPNIIIN